MALAETLQNASLRQRAFERKSLPKSPALLGLPARFLSLHACASCHACCVYHGVACALPWFKQSNDLSFNFCMDSTSPLNNELIPVGFASDRLVPEHQLGGLFDPRIQEFCLVAGRKSIQRRTRAIANWSRLVSVKSWEDQKDWILLMSNWEFFWLTKQLLHIFRPLYI